jgi:hypothetical protein
MTAKLVTIDAIDHASDVVDVLERALLKAHAGEFSSIAIGLVYRDGSISHMRSAAPSFPCQIAALHRCAHRMQLDLDERVDG